MDRDGFACQQCYDSESTLNVHHLYYSSGRKIWEYPDNAMVTLCNECHSDEHLIGQNKEGLIDQLFDYIDSVEKIPAIAEGISIFYKLNPYEASILSSLFLSLASSNQSINPLIKFLYNYTGRRSNHVKKYLGVGRLHG